MRSAVALALLRDVRARLSFLRLGLTAGGQRSSLARGIEKLMPRLVLELRNTFAEERMRHAKKEMRAFGGMRHAFDTNLVDRKAASASLPPSLP